MEARTEWGKDWIEGEQMETVTTVNFSENFDFKREGKRRWLMKVLWGYLRLYLYESESRSVVSNPLRIHGLYIVHGILQARLLERVAFPFPRGSSQPSDWTQVSHIAGGFFTSWATREAQEYWSEVFFTHRRRIPFSRESSQPRNWTGVSCIASGFFTNYSCKIVKT